MDSGEPTQSTTAATPPASWPLSSRIEPVRARDRAGRARPGATTTSAPSSEARLALERVLGGGEDLAAGRDAPQGGEGEQAEGAAADDGDLAGVDRARRRARRRRWARRGRPPRRTGRRARGRAGTRGPPSAWTSRRRWSRRTRTAGPGSRSPKPMRSQWLMRPSAQAAHTGSMPRATQLSTGTTTTRVPSSSSPDDLVAGGERERHDRLEPARRRAVDGGEVGAADAGQAGAHPHPARARAARAGRRRAGRAGPTLAPPPGDEPAGDHGGRELGRLAREHERLHRRPRLTPAAPAADRCHRCCARLAAAHGRGSRPCRRGGAGGPTRADGEQRRRAPAALSKCSTSQPRLRASAARRVSGLTATGKPTASSIGQVGRRVGVGDAPRRRRSRARRRSRTGPGRGPRRWAARR